MLYMNRCVPILQRRSCPTLRLPWRPSTPGTGWRFLPGVCPAAIGQPSPLMSARPRNESPMKAGEVTASGGCVTAG
jgi:hypothetical protein